jgi:hypothetical protein
VGPLTEHGCASLPRRGVNTQTSIAIPQLLPCRSHSWRFKMRKDVSSHLSIAMEALVEYQLVTMAHHKAVSCDWGMVRQY